MLHAFFLIASLGRVEKDLDLPVFCFPLCDGRELGPSSCQISILSLNDRSLAVLLITSEKFTCFRVFVFLLCFCFCFFLNTLLDIKPNCLEAKNFGVPTVVSSQAHHCI